MENPYQKAEIKPHYLAPAMAEALCFDIFNVISASQSFAGIFEASEADEDDPYPSLSALHHKLAEPRLSLMLLQLAVFVRTFDDVMSAGAASERYAQHAAATDGGDALGHLDGNRLNLREACNKIIHAADVRPVYEHTDREGVPGDAQAWHLTGEIELKGSRGTQEWNATLYVEPFLEIVLDRIAFDPRTKD